MLSKYTNEVSLRLRVPEPRKIWTAVYRRYGWSHVSASSTSDLWTSSALITPLPCTRNTTLTSEQALSNVHNIIHQLSSLRIGRTSLLGFARWLHTVPACKRYPFTNLTLADSASVTAPPLWNRCIQLRHRHRTHPVSYTLLLGSV